MDELPENLRPLHEHLQRMIDEVDVDGHTLAIVSATPGSDDDLPVVQTAGPCRCPMCSVAVLYAWLETLDEVLKRTGDILSEATIDSVKADAAKLMDNVTTLMRGYRL